MENSAEKKTDNRALSILAYIVIAMIFRYTASFIDNLPYPDSSVNTPQQNSEASTPPNYQQEKSTDSYSGSYYNSDRSTGWETTVDVSGTSFSAVTIAPTGDVIASGSGSLRGSILVDEYGQNVGSVSNNSLSIMLGARTIDCVKR